MRVAAVTTPPCAVGRSRHTPRGPSSRSCSSARNRADYAPSVDNHPPVRVERRPVSEAESRRANGPDWDRYADEYQATHGEFLGDAGFVWGPEGLTEDAGRGPRRRRRTRTSSRSAPVPASARAGCAHAAAGPTASTCPSASSSTRAASTTRPGVAVPSVLGTATALPFARRLLRRRLLVVRRAAVRQRHRRRGRRDRPGAAPRRPLRLLDHPPDAVDVPRRPRRGGPGREPVLLGPHAVRRGRRRAPASCRTSSTTAPWATGWRCSPGTAS